MVFTSESNRAQSEVIGFVLILVLTMGGIAGIMTFGVQVLERSSDSAEISSVEHAYTELDSQASLVAHGTSPARSVSLSQNMNSNQYVSSAGWMNITIDPDNEDNIEVNRSIGAVIYETGDTQIAYQGGGVWKKVDGGSTMVSPPEFHYRDDTLTLPMIAVEGSGQVGSDLHFAKTDETAHFPTDDVSNPLSGGNVTITIQSEYYEAWGHFFEERTQGRVSYPGGDRVRIRLQVIEPHPALSGSLGGFGVSGQSMSMGGFNRFVADSYDSSNASYSEAPAKRNARVASSDDAHFASDGGLPDPFWINGTLAVAGDSVEPDEVEDHVDTIEYNADVPELDAEWHIRQMVEDFEDREELLDDGTIDNNQTVIKEGEYYLDEDLQLENGAELVLDTTDGPIDIRINGDVEIRDSDITITGGNDHRAKIYADGEVIMEDDVTVAENSADNATLFWLYATDDVRFGIDSQGNPPISNIEYTGVLYAPDGEGFLHNADIEIKGSVAVEDVGSGPGQQNNIDNVDLDLHYDENLQDEEPFEGTPVISINYLHITVSEITVQS